jgi:hypothetical protein
MWNQALSVWSLVSMALFIAFACYASEGWAAQLGARSIAYRDELFF